MDKSRLLTDDEVNGIAQAYVAPRREPYAYTRSKLFYLTEPAAGTYVVKVQSTGGVFIEFEISKAQLANFLVDGTALALRDLMGRAR